MTAPTYRRPYRMLRDPLLWVTLTVLLGGAGILAVLITVWGAWAVIRP